MTKILLTLLLILGINAFSQVTNFKIVTKQNDTIKVDLKMTFLTMVDLNYKLQEKLIFSYNGVKRELLPVDVTSFSFDYNDKTYNYESIDNKLFGQPMYKNKLKLYRFIKPAYTPINFYIIVRPENAKTSYMEAMGLSRLISKKVINREIADCSATISKVESKELKINGEKGVIELIKDYENNCY